MKDLSEALPLMEQMRANAAKGKAARKQLDLAETAVTTLWAELKTLSDEREILLGKIKEIVNDFE